MGMDLMLSLRTGHQSAGALLLVVVTLLAVWSRRCAARA